MRRDIALFLGLVAIICGGIIAAVIFLFDDGGGGESSVCDRPLPPQGDGEISQDAFQARDAGITQVIEAARTGNVQAANEAYYADNNEIHNFTINIDQRLRGEDEELAKELCEAVMTLEEELFATDPSSDAIATEAKRIRELLRDAAEALERGGGQTVFLSGVNPDTGELEVPMINLWSLSGCQRAGVAGTVESGMAVHVLQVKKECDPDMYEVETFGANAGQRGWVSEVFIRR